MRGCLSVASVVSGPLWSPRLQLARLLCPRDFSDKKTGESYHALLQGIFPTQGSNQHLFCLLHCRQILWRKTKMRFKLTLGKQLQRWWLCSYKMSNDKGRMETDVSSGTSHVLISSYAWALRRAAWCSCTIAASTLFQQTSRWECVGVRQSLHFQGFFSLVVQHSHYSNFNYIQSYINYIKFLHYIQVYYIVTY